MSMKSRGKPVSRGKPAPVTVEMVLDELNRLKKKHEGERQKWLKREAELNEKVKAANVRATQADARADAATGPTVPAESLRAAKLEGLEAVLDLLVEMEEKHHEGAAEWADLTGKQRADSSRELRVWAHPFVGQLLEHAVSKVQELKGELNGHGTEEESGAS